MRAALLVIVMVNVGPLMHAKEHRTLYDDAMLARMRNKIEKHDWAKKQVASLRKDSLWYTSKSDEELWDMVPPAEQMRAINVHIAHDCPVCGDEITRKAGHYPWKMDRDKPFKLTCPVCERTFPDNDFEPWNTGGLSGTPVTGQSLDNVVDEGLGWVGPDGRRYWMVPYYIFWQRWVRDILGGMHLLGRAYLATGDPVYGRKCAVLMARVAQMYDRFDYAKQCYHEGRFNIPGRISDRIWSTGDNTKIAQAYDAIFPIFDDPALVSFLEAKGIKQARQTIEQNMLNQMARDVMSGFVAGNQGMHQRTLCTLAIVLNNDDEKRGPTTAQMRDWIMTGDGRVEDLLWNGFWREGLGTESSPTYSSSWCSNFYSIAELLPKLGVNIWDNPKLKKMADAGIDMTIADKWSPCIGDSGGIRGSGPVAISSYLQGLAFTQYGDPRHAQALARINAQSRDLFADHFDEDKVAEVAAAHGTDLNLKTRDIGGYGLAILESGEGEHRRAAAMYYGFAGGGHGHRDRLNIQMWALGKAMLPEDGYPTPFTRPNFWRWRNTDTHKHYCVVVDDTSQTSQIAGDLNTLAASPTVQLMDASAAIAYPGAVSLYRRTSALIDISKEDAYLLDIFRVRGGKKHDWCFHGPAFFELEVTGGKFGPTQTKGTLAGEDIAFGKEAPNTSGYHGLYNVRRMKPAETWRAIWRNVDEDLNLTMTMPAGCAQEVIVADASPEVQPGNPEVIQYVLGRNEGEALSSEYIAVIEPHRGSANVQSVRQLSAGAAGAVGVIIEREGETDLVHSSMSNDETCNWQGAKKAFNVAAEFGLVTLDEQGVKRAILVDGSLLQFGEFELRPGPSPRGRVEAVNFKRNQIVIDTALADADQWRDTVVILGNDLHSTSYTVVDTKTTDGKTTLHFGDTLFVIAMGAVAAIDGNNLTSDRPLAGYGRTDGGKHEGRWLYNEDHSRGFRILSIKDQVLTLDTDGAKLDDVYTDTDGDGRKLYWISDVGPGDTYRMPRTTHYVRKQP